VLSLALLIDQLRQHNELQWKDVLVFWQQFRQNRLNDLLDLTKRLNNKRMPLEKQATLSKDDLWFDESQENPNQMAWLYVPKIEEKIQAWIDEKLKN
jgi:hypothetical protein